MNLLVIGIGCEKDLIIGYGFKGFISCIPTENTISITRKRYELCRTLCMMKMPDLQNFLQISMHIQVPCGPVRLILCPPPSRCLWICVLTTRD